MTNCPCCSGLAFAQCCGPLLSGEQAARTAEALMRSRYTAYTRGQIEYLTQTLHPDYRNDQDVGATRRWAANAEWIQLKVVQATQGADDDKEGEVEFIATYREKGLTRNHHEIGQFRKQDGIWYFTEGKIVPIKTQMHETPKIGRNEPCPCGSGKKFKKCCGQ